MVLPVAIIAAIGCAPTISYNLREIPVINNRKFKQLTISIQPFEDNREENSYLKKEIFDTAAKNEVECYNSESKYGNLKVGNEMSELLAEHIVSTGIFKKAYYNHKESADIYLTGKIASFAAHVKVNESARDVHKIGTFFGEWLITDVATSLMKSNYDFEIKYSEITVFDKSGDIVYQIPEMVSAEKKEVSAATSCNQIFDLINADLKIHNQKLIDKVLSELPEAINKTNR